MLGATPQPMPMHPPIRPMTIHGRRMPNRDAVRSLIRPKNGFPTMATRAPIPATSAKLSGLFDPDQRIDLQRQGHQHRREKH